MPRPPVPEPLPAAELISALGIDCPPELMIRALTPALASLASALGDSTSTATTLPVMASTLTSVMSLVSGLAMSKDQISLPCSFSSSPSLTVPP